MGKEGRSATPQDEAPRGASPHRFALRHYALLGAGFLLGIGAALLAAALEPEFAGEIAEARRLGVVSHTVRAGYPLTLNILRYASALLLPLLGALALWYPWARRHPGAVASLQMPPQGAPAGSRPYGALLLALAAAAGVLFTYQINLLYLPGDNAYVGSWVFLGEEGENLSWAQSILSGGTYGKDFFCLYGPLMIYPLAGVMKIFGATVTAGRVYTFCLGALAMLITAGLLGRSLRWRPFLFASTLLIAVLFLSPGAMSPNSTILRVALGMLPLIPLHRYLGARKRRWLLLAGAGAGASLLFSQEMGLCALVASTAMLGADLLRHRKIVDAAKELLLFLAGLGAVVGPMLLYLAARGGLSPALSDMIEYPRLLALGYAGRPFPTLASFLADPLGPALLPYAVIFLYSATALLLAPAYLLGRIDRDLILRTGILVFGVLAFRKALGRALPENYHQVSYPAFLLALIFIEDGLRRALGAAGLLRRRLEGACAALLACAVALVVLASPILKGNVVYHLRNGLDVRTKFTRSSLGSSLPGLARAGRVYYSAHTARSVGRIEEFFRRFRVSPGEVYFYPNEAAYYFLFDSVCPTRFVLSYLAVTTEQRREIVRDLERKKVPYVVYSKETWRVDGIPEQEMVPELHAYIMSAYRPLVDFGDIAILERIRGPGR